MYTRSGLDYTGFLSEESSCTSCHRAFSECKSKAANCCTPTVSASGKHKKDPQDIHKLLRVASRSTTLHHDRVTSCQPAGEPQMESSRNGSVEVHLRIFTEALKELVVVL